MDEEELMSKISLWQEEYPDDQFSFRPHQEKTSVEFNPCEDDGDIVDMSNIKTPSEENLLFVHQTHWQKALLQRYGGEICLLDATYKTTKYSLPLFFLCVKTNVDYCIVGSFITQYENEKSIKEALEILSSWNPEWQPRYMMTDYCEAEINAIENLFPGI